MFSPGEFHGQRSLASYIQSMGHKASDTTKCAHNEERPTGFVVQWSVRSFPREQIAKAGLIGKHFVFALNQGQARPSSPDSADSTCTKEMPFTWKIPTKAGKLDAHASRSLGQVWPKTHLVKRKGAFMCCDLRFSGEVEQGRSAQNLRRGCDVVNRYTGQTGGAVVR